MKKSFLVLVLSLFFNEGFTQNLELGKVTKKELEARVHSIDTSAPAAFIFKKAKTFFTYNIKNGFECTTKFSIKLKIYKKEGFRWANFEIPYYVGYQSLDDEKVFITKAFAYNLENGKIDKQRVTSEGKFVEKVNDLWQTKMITFPNIKEGSIIELEYELRSPNLSELPTFQFQYNIPVDYAQLQTEIPEFYIYKAIKSGYVNVTMNDVMEHTSISYNNKYNQIEYLGFQQIKTLYEVAEVPALIEEDYVSNIDDYYGKIQQELQLIRFPKEEPKQIATTWESVAKSIYEDKQFGAELNKNSYFLNNLKQITDKIESKEERLMAIYEFVKNKMTWNGKYGYYTKKGVEAAYNESSGNVAEINLMLTAMLKMGGLEANPVLLSTRDNGVALFPNRSKFNYVIACVDLDGKQILLDATEKFASINCLPTRDLISNGRLIKKDGSSIEVNLIPKYNSNDIIYLLVNIDKTGLVSGHLREQYFDYNALRFRQRYVGISIENYLEKLENKHDGIEVENYELKNEKSVYEPVIETYNIKNNNVVEVIGDKMFFSPLLYLAMKQNPFKQENRQYPIDFSFPNKDKYQLTITIPDGYEVESLPKSASITMVDKLISFVFSVTKTDNKINVSMSLDSNNYLIPADYYDSLKEFFKVVIDKQNEKIVLKKI
jgi:Domain of Unknown Function with PDB structure (DUF3857)